MPRFCAYSTGPGYFVRKAAVTKEFRVVRLHGKTIPESASCDDPECDWVSEDEKTLMKDARRHTLDTGHDTVVWSYKAAWYSRR